eukprot:CAMPEP_0170356300 /NCGR_PEP_ID=MMETSP0117_2-20130122/1100_1 /TAXON_ID=400756 /ORGANISM="Durinskia baltica, Strain CSIRO CS-38" /LENGTH=996 /DNA_ID=CAMNT_0010610391 /DNA_START=441 /DNA_END=3431 /DNA_ORIENTATION=-
MYMESITNLISDFTATLLLGASGQIPFNELPPMDAKLKEMMEKSASLPGLLKNLKQAISFLLGELNVPPAEKAVLAQLSGTLDEQVTALQAFYPHAAGYVNALESARRSSRSSGGGKGGEGSQLPRGSPELFKVASHCMKTSKALKLAIQSARPPPPPEDDGGMINKIKSLLNFSESLEGGERITFPYMRCLITDRFKAETFSLMGCDNNTIHGVIFPACTTLPGASSNAGTNSSGNNSATDSGSSSAPMSPVGIVIFCSPNAGFFEGMCQSDLKSSWLGYYLQHGYDVCMFNYRGYGLSTGTPHPHGIKQDACQIYEHIQCTRRPYRIIMHGESIGGMVASHVASTFPVDALICDRTFCTLDATAARLMGQWAGIGLKYCTLWSTNVARDYLAAKCPKIILQDPDDEIIANLSSLKNGVAMRLVMGDLSWKMVAEPWEYTYSVYQKAVLPYLDREADLLEKAGYATESLSEAFVAHFYACVADIAKRSAIVTAGPARRRPRSSIAAMAPVLALNASTPRPRQNRGGGGGGFQQSDLDNKPISAGGKDSVSALEDGYSSSHSSRHDAFNNEDEDDGFDSDTSSRDIIINFMGMRASSSDATDLDLDLDLEDPDQNGAASADSMNRGHRNLGHLLSGVRAPTSRKEWLEQFCATPMRDVEPSLGSSNNSNSSGRNTGSGSGAAGSGKGLGPAPITKAWAAVGRIDGGSGQLLGQALSGGIEGVRAWMCAWLVWSSNASADLSLPKGCTDVSGGINDLKLLTEELHIAELRDDRSVSFLKRALESLQRRRDALIFHKPPLGVLLQGAMAYHSEEGRNQLDMQDLHPISDMSGNVAGMSAGSPPSALQEMLSTVGTVVGGFLFRAKKFFSSNKYASIDACAEIDQNICAHSSALGMRESCRGMLPGGAGSDTASAGPVYGSGSVDAELVSPAMVRSSCAMRWDAEALQSGELFVAANMPSAQHMPYVGHLVALHTGHNGWPSPSEIDAIDEFFVNASLA